MRKRFNMVLLTLTLLSTNCPAFSQAAGANQQIFQDEQQMLHTDNGQVQHLESQEQQYKQEVDQQQTSEQPYKLYVEQRIHALEKIRQAHGSPALSTANTNQLYALQQWLIKDRETREQEQAHIKQLDKAIANMQQQTNATFSDLGNDINAMRENQQQVADDDKFNKMMRINMFNELQTEMGAASWGGSPTDGTYNSVGGYGFLGGYGYSMGGGRRGL